MRVVIAEAHLPIHTENIRAVRLNRRISLVSALPRVLSRTDDVTTAPVVNHDRIIVPPQTSRPRRSIYIPPSNRVENTFGRSTPRSGDYAARRLRAAARLLASTKATSFGSRQAESHPFPDKRNEPRGKLLRYLTVGEIGAL